MRRDDLSLLVPEWQGCGLDAAVSDGARALAALFPADGFVTIDTPREERLTVEDGVLGLSSIAETTRQTLEVIRAHQPSRIFTVGGTCGVELAPVSYLADRYRGDFAVVWLDAHGDLNTPQTSPSGHFHGMVLRTLLGTGPAPLVSLVSRPLVPSQVVLAGVRDLDRGEAKYVSDLAVSRLGPADLLVPDRVVGRVRAGGVTKLYVHLDLDVLDPIEFSDALMRVPGGVAIDCLVDTIAGLASAFDIMGFSVVEFAPRSADAAARVRRILDRCGIEIGVLAHGAGVR
jgi:arginase